MRKRKNKLISFDAMVKFFMQQYNIPTKRDFESLMLRMDKLEKLIKSSINPVRNRRVPGKVSGKGKTSANKSATASDTVLNFIKTCKNGAGFAQIKAETDFGEKKLRNIIFRLDQTNKIKRKSRGIYIAS